MKNIIITSLLLIILPVSALADADNNHPRGRSIGCAGRHHGRVD